MRRRRTQTALIWLLGIGSIVLAWVIYLEVADLSETEAVEAADVAAEGDPSPTQSPVVLSIPDKESLAVILERPVFAQTRRPAGRASESPVSTSIDFLVSGVVISGDERSALIRPANGEDVQQLKVGENIAGWTLVEVAGDRVIVRRDTIEAEVFLDYAAPAPDVRTEIPKHAPETGPASGNVDERQMNGTGDPEAEPNAAPQN
jgi:type II secretory pathway component PulC